MRNAEAIYAINAYKANDDGNRRELWLGLYNVDAAEEEPKTHIVGDDNEVRKIERHEKLIGTSWW